MGQKNRTRLKNKDGNLCISTPHCNIGRLVAVLGAKGGVGRSFVMGYLAAALARLGHTVGILDADYAHPSISSFFGVTGPAVAGEYSFQPVITPLRIKIISTDLLFNNEAQQVIWKEQLIGKVVEELLKEVEWGELDFLLVDLPIMSTESAISLLQVLPFTGALVVNTPQLSALKIANRGLAAVHKTGIPIIGVIENMAFFVVPGTQDDLHIFGPSLIESLALSTNSPILTKIPLVPQIATFCDQGRIEEFALDDEPEILELFFESLQKIESEKIKSNINAQNEGQPVSTQNYFSEIVMDLFHKKENMGTLEDPDAQGHFLGSCGDSMQIDLKMDGEEIRQARFMADGCGATIACGSMITKMACNKRIPDAQKISPDDLLEALGGLPDDHLHCAELAVMALREALIDAIEGHRTSSVRK